MTGCIVLGGGGHARVLIDLMREAGLGDPVGILDPDEARWGGTLDGVAILGGDDLLPNMRERGVTSFVVGVGSAGDTTARRRLFALGLEHGLEPLTLRHPSAICSSAATVGAGSQLLPGSIVNAGASLGTNVIVNSGAIVEHDCRIGDHAHIATGAKLASTVVVGAGAVVVADVTAKTVVVGVPAAPLRPSA